MDSDTAAKLRARAKRGAESQGFRDDAEDLAQDTILHYLEGKGQHQKVDHALVDCIRQRFGQEREKNYDKKTRLRNAGSGVSGPEVKGLQVPQHHHDFDLDRLTAKLPERLRAVVFLHFKWGLTLPEIAEAFGITEWILRTLYAKAMADITSLLKDEDAQVSQVRSYSGEKSDGKATRHGSHD